MTRKEFCKRGHRMTESNSRWRSVGKYRLRGCRACNAEYNRLRYRKQVLGERFVNSNVDSLTQSG